MNIIAIRMRTCRRVIIDREPVGESTIQTRSIDIDAKYKFDNIVGPIVKL